MVSKSQIKQLLQLQQKKYRDDQKLFIAEGPKIVNELLSSKYKVKEIYATKEFKSSGLHFTINHITEKELEQISALTTPNQVLGVFDMHTDVSSPFIDGTSSLILALDDIRDPGNLGTIIRISDWFGISKIICSENCVDVYNPKVVQATMGSIARVEVTYVNLLSTLNEFKNQKTKIYGAVMKGKNIYSEKLSGNGVILIGNESRGISERFIQFVTDKISIPNFGKADSLNAAIATAVICSEFRRR